MALSEIMKRWWPLPSSLDLVRAPIEAAAAAVGSEISRFADGRALRSNWVPFRSLDDVFSGVDAFTNVPTVFYVIPTVSEWSVLWNNGYTCDGYDSLCWCITEKHRRVTVHWRASDTDTSCQAGTQFSLRRFAADGMKQRVVSCCRCDKRWDWRDSGEPWPEEDVEGYGARRCRDRLNEQRMVELLGRLGARPWDDDFYLPAKAFRIEWLEPWPNTVSKRFEEIASEHSSARG